MIVHHIVVCEINANACSLMQSQKTVCKHLLEAPYSHGVVDDPISAMQRVRNNRKVNHLKKQAIDLGREHMGEKGQGKGKPTLKIGNSEDSLGEEDNSADEALSEEDPDLQTAVVKVTPRKTRKAPHSSSEDGNYHSTGNFHTPKKAKRQSRSKYQVVGKEMVEVPKSTRNGTSSRRMKGQDLAQAMKKSLENAQQSQETVGNQDFSEWQSFNPQEHEYPYASTQPDAMLPQYQPIGHEFPLEHNQGPQHPVQSLDYSSSGTDGNLFFQDPAYDYASYFGHSNHRSH